MQIEIYEFDNPFAAYYNDVMIMMIKTLIYNLEISKGYWIVVIFANSRSRLCGICVLRVNPGIMVNHSSLSAR